MILAKPPGFRVLPDRHATAAERLEATQLEALGVRIMRSVDIPAGQDVTVDLAASYPSPVRTPSNLHEGGALTAHSLRQPALGPGLSDRLARLGIHRVPSLGLANGDETWNGVYRLADGQ